FSSRATSAESVSQSQSAYGSVRALKTASGLASMRTRRRWGSLGVVTGPIKPSPAPRPDHLSVRMSFDADGRRRRAEHVVMATLTASTRPLIFVVSFAALMVAHQLGDHVLQTDRQALGKTGRGPTAVLAMLGHLLSYHVAG